MLINGRYIKSDNITSTYMNNSSDRAVFETINEDKTVFCSREQYEVAIMQLQREMETKRSNQ